MDKCATCRFFQAYPLSNDPDEAEMIDGECRLNPPRAGISEDDPTMGVWPWIHADDWCGKYESAPVKSLGVGPALAN